MTRIYLIGYMGSGKSSVSKALAESLDWTPVDMDALIEERSGQSISTIFKYFGEKEFRKLEASALHQSTCDDEAVIATGGGAPCFHDNMDIMLAEGLVFYLKVDVDQLIKRISQDTSVRPIVHEKSEAELQEFIYGHLKERAPFYEKAHHVIDANQTIAKIVEEIKTHLEA